MMIRKIKHSTLSKDVAWDGRKVSIPSPDEAAIIVGAARRGNYGATYQLLEWHRFAPSPENDTDTATMNSISKAYEEVTER